jgi:circadian clock protein KaiB
MPNSGEKEANANDKSDDNDSLNQESWDTEAFEEALKDHKRQDAEYILRLYVTGSTSRSLKAISNLKRLCDEYLPGHYELQVIDIYKNPDAIRGENIIAAPTLIKQLPAPLRRFVGDLSNTHKILVGLGIK